MSVNNRLIAMTAWTLVALASLVLAGCARSSPNIELSQPEVDLGEVVNGEIISFDVAVHNSGSEALIVEAVTTSCGCTIAEVTPSAIEPGDSGTLSIRYDSGAHGPEELGSVMRQVFVTTNDPDEQEVEFRFTAVLIPAAP